MMAHSLRAGWLSLQQPHKASLFKVDITKVDITGEGFIDASLLHDDETGAIYQRPSFVRSPLKQVPRLRIQTGVNVNNFHDGRGFQIVDEPDNSAVR
jgi:hypothetical protein